MTASSNGREQFWAALHGIRGIAVLYVVFSHMGNMGLPLLPFHHDGIGKAGVWIFFVLSAFLLTSRLTELMERGMSPALVVAGYFVSRFFRIYPLYVVVLVLHVIRHHIGLQGFVLHLMLMQGVDELWAIPVEFKFYFAIPLIALLAHVASRHVALVAVLALAILAQCAAIAQPSEVYSNSISLLPKAFPFLLGSLLSLCWKDMRALGWIGNPLWASVLGAFLIAGMVEGTILYREIQLKALPIELAPWNSLFVTVIVVGLIYVSFSEGLLKRLFCLRVLVFTGEISFSIYLLHMFVVAPSLRVSLMAPQWKAWPVLGVVYACAYLAHRLIETPGIALGKRVVSRIQRRRSCPSL